MKVLPKYFICLLYCLLHITISAQTISGNMTEHQPVNRKAIDSLQQQLKLNHPDSVRIDMLYLLAKFLHTEDMSSALLYIKEGITLCDRTNNTYKKAKLLDWLGRAYHIKADDVNATSCFFQAIRLFESLNKNGNNVKLYDKDISECYNHIGLCYATSKQYSSAEKYLLEGLKYNIKSVNILVNLGQCAVALGRTHDGFLYTEKAFAISNYTDGVACNNIGDIYFQLDQLDSAERYYKQALLLTEAGTFFNVALSVSLGELYVKQNKFDEAAKYLFMAEQVAEKLDFKRLYPNIYEAIVKMYVKQQDWVNAYQYKDKLYILKVAEIDANIAKQVSEMQTKYESDKKDKEIQLFNQKQAIAQAQVRNQLMLRNFIVAAAILILIIGMVVARNNILKQRVKNKALNEEKALIEKANMRLLHESISARYETLKSKVNPHFLFNSFSTLSALVSRKQDTALEFIENLSDMYRMILETTEVELLSLEEELKIVKNYLYLQQMEFGDNLLVEIDISEHLYDYILPPFAIQMVVENAIKHNTISEKHKLKILIMAQDDVIVVENNLQKRRAIQASTGIGRKNITERYKLISPVEPVFIETSNTYRVELPLMKTKSKIKEEWNILV